MATLPRAETGHPLRPWVAIAIRSTWRRRAMFVDHRAGPAGLGIDRHRMALSPQPSRHALEVLARLPERGVETGPL